MEKVNFVWDQLEKQWNDKYLELKSYFQREGHLNMPFEEYQSLSQWSTKQRKLYFEKKLSQEKINLLEKIKFTWDTTEQQDQNWHINFEKLKTHYEKEGHTNLPRKSNLGGWCSNQRECYKKGNLSQEKINLLEEIEFFWNIN